MKRALRQTTRTRAARQRQSGIVLLLVLIIMVVLSGAAIWAAKASISGEQVANNIRLSSTVGELAELALRYCEDGVIKGNTTLIRLPFPLSSPSGSLPTAWQDLGNWASNNGKVNTVPATQLADAMGHAPTLAPVCMIEEMRLAPVDMQRMQGYVITARAFSEDYRESNSGAVTSGTDAWVQSMIRY